MFTIMFFENSQSFSIEISANEILMFDEVSPAVQKSDDTPQRNKTCILLSYLFKYFRNFLSNC